jgi:hypothetical protein
MCEVETNEAGFQMTPKTENSKPNSQKWANRLHITVAYVQFLIEKKIPVSIKLSAVTYF